MTPRCQTSRRLGSRCALRDTATCRLARLPRRRCGSSSTNRGRSSPRRGSRSPSTASPRRPTRRDGSPSEIAGPVVIKSQVLTGGRMKAGGVQFADTPERGRAPRRARARPRDQRPHAARRAGRLAGRGQARVLRRRRLGRDPQAPGDAVLRHGRDRHRGGRRAAPRSRRPRATSRPSRPVLRLAGQAGDRVARHHRLGAEPPDPDPRPARAAVPCSTT